MIEAENSEAASIAALTAFCVGNSDLEALEGLLSEFNFFEAAGLTREEIRHSRFLSFLLDPRGAHGLGSLFATRVLQAAVHGRVPEQVGVTALELELMDLSDLQVACEVQRIDLLMLSDRNRFAVVIENKVSAREHSNQLPRYLKVVEAMRPGWRVLPILLSPQGTEPSDPRYFAVSYESIAAILHSILEAQRKSLGPDVALALDHYERLLRRHVVSDSKLNELCQRIVAKHRKALVILLQHMDDPKSRLWRLTDRMLEDAGFVRTDRRWLPATWQEWMPRSEQAGPGYIAGFWVDVYGRRVRLLLELQPGPDAARRALFEAARGSPLFKVRRREMTGLWSRIFDLELSATREPDGNEEEWAAAMEERIRAFAAETLPQMEEVLRRAVTAP